MSKNSKAVSAAVEGAPPKEKPELRKGRFETAVTVFTVVVALFGVGQYFYDTASARADKKKERAIAYIDQYANNSSLGARQELANFWVGQPGLVKVFRTTEITPRSYLALLEASVFRSSRDVPIREALLELDNFFTQLGFCRSSGLCNPQLLDTYFCETAQKYTFVYKPFFDRISELTGDAGIGRELANYSEICIDPQLVQ